MKWLFTFLIGAIVGAASLYGAALYAERHSMAPVLPRDIEPGQVVTVSAPCGPLPVSEVAAGYLNIPPIELGIPQALPAITVPPLKTRPIVEDKLSQQAQTPRPPKAVHQ